MAQNSMKPVKESSIEDYLARRCDELGIYQHKNTGRNGIPDRLLIFDARHWFLELKRPGKAPTELQESVARELRSHGAVTLWADSRDAVEQVVAALTQGGDPPWDRMYGRPKSLARKGGQNI
ncbi:MAG: hypothetical protein NC311_10000 [Muribaculaceae bacterium]|nr:hypothetical protein [Muribaculaceae bacterium]